MGDPTLTIPPHKPNYLPRPYCLIMKHWKLRLPHVNWGGGEQKDSVYHSCGCGMFRGDHERGLNVLAEIARAGEERHHPFED